MNLFIFASVKKRLLNIILLCFLLAMVACGGPSQHATEADFQEAQIQYDSGFVLSSQDSLLAAKIAFFLQTIAENSMNLVARLLCLLY